MFQLTNAPPTAAFAAIIDHRKKRNIALGSPLVAIELTIQATKSTPMANLTTTKLLLDSTISTPGAKFLGIDLAIFYLNTPMPNPKYMHICLDVIPDKIIVHYNLHDIVAPDG
jgi:hypothetical protein